MDYVKTLRKSLCSQKIILNGAGAVIVKNGKVLLQKRSDNARWGLIGGLMELDETYEQCAIREAREETGLDISLTGFLGIFHNHDMVWSNGDKAHTVSAYFLAEPTGGEPRADAESLELRFFSKHELPNLFAPDHVLALNAYYREDIHPLLTENAKP